MTFAPSLLSLLKTSKFQINSLYFLTPITQKPTPKKKFSPLKPPVPSPLKPSFRKNKRPFSPKFHRNSFCKKNEKKVPSVNPVTGLL